MTVYNLEDRTLEFSKTSVNLAKRLPFNRVNDKIVDQFIRSSTSVGANYREANECETKKDFKNRIRIAKKEAKETIYWLDIILEENHDFKEEIKILRSESIQLMKILASIYNK